MAESRTPKRRGFGWHKHPAKILFISPVLAVVIAWAVVIGEAPAGWSAHLLTVFYVTAGLATAGPAVGGLLIRGTPLERLFASIGFGILGFIAYCAGACCGSPLLDPLNQSRDFYPG